MSVRCAPKKLIGKGEKASRDYHEILSLPTTSQIKAEPTSTRKLRTRKEECQLIKFDKNVLFRAALSDDLKSVSSMNFTGNDVNSCDSFGWSGLMIAACEGSRKVCEFLLAKDCDLTVADRSGNTALSLAKKKNRTEIVEMIEDKMANVRKTTTSDTLIQPTKHEPFWCEECQHTFKETTKESHEASTLHRFNRKNTYEFTRRYFIPDSNIGFKMMLRQGWDRESGLGPNSEGKLFPVKTTLRKARSGLGVKQDHARREKRSDGDCMMDDATKTINLLIETERLADKILQNKHEIVALDKRRQDTREAIRELGKSREKKAWITVGSMLIEMKKDKALELLQLDQKVIDQEINKLRSDQKVLVGQHRDLEFADQVKGFDLNPMSRDEIGVLRTNLPGF